MTFSRFQRIGAVVLGLLIGLRAGAALAQTPSLAELAQKEQERRRGLKTTAAKVFSDKDLPKPQTPAVASSVPSTPTVVPAEQPKPAEAKPEDQKDEAWWRGRMAQSREAQRRAEAFAEALQSRINALSTDMVNRDDPYQRAKIGDDRQKALAELQRVTNEIEQAKKEITDIEEEARRANVPPGWLR
jgi:chromosome segregation ATPase